MHWMVPCLDRAALRNGTTVHGRSMEHSIHLDASKLSARMVGRPNEESKHDQKDKASHRITYTTCLCICIDLCKLECIRPCIRRKEPLQVSSEARSGRITSSYYFIGIYQKEVEIYYLAGNRKQQIRCHISN
jgi:hypothetical protein